jgi:uncharacterized membrane protein
MNATYLLIGSLLVCVAIPLALGKVPRNSLYGFRTRAALSDDRIWYPTNRALGRAFAVSGLILVGLGAFARQLSVGDEISTLLVTLPAVLLPGIVATAITQQRASARAPDRSE